MGLIVILGCGPAGLAAAKAVTDLGHEAIIISNTDKPSKIYGCQYLHAPIPGYEQVPSVRVSYSLTGTPEQYRLKVYGLSWKGKVSPEDFVGEHDAWDIRETYSRLWDDIILGQRAGLIVSKVKSGRIPFAQSLQPDLIISSIPAQALCFQLHSFSGHTIWANGSTSAEAASLNTIICDGTSERPWYRISNVFGYATTEWSTPPHNNEGAVPVVKPLSTDCTCHPEVVRVGRYGCWEKARLVHEVYPAVAATLEPSRTFLDERSGRWKM
jgi:hypothetical protein